MHLAAGGNATDARRSFHEDLQILDFMFAERVQPAAIEHELVSPLEGARDVCEQRKVDLRGWLVDVLALVARWKPDERLRFGGT